MPSLTVHDITHIDALWWTASEVAGSDYPLNPAEAFVLGGAFLLHDSAHCIAAYPGGIEEIRKLPEWQVNCSKYKVLNEKLEKGTEVFQLILFEVLRNMHPRQARVLAKVSWSIPGDNAPLFLLPNDDLRRAYADVIGQIAESHWFSPHQLESFNHSKVTTPACLHPSPWTIDILKLAVLLRTADASHVDAQRAPRFLQALVQPEGVSLTHWNFQARINQIKIDPDPARKELIISGSEFPIDEQEAWWMAYDTARMIDNELKSANRILLDLHRPQLAARSVALSYSPEAFSRNVATSGWHPVDTSIKITDIKTMVDRFGGEKLYGRDPVYALRELIQNSVDAIHACRSLGGLGEDEGEIDVKCEPFGENYWLQVTDTGIGMSRYVLTDILLDFGRSLWRSGDVRGEWKNLASTSFEAIGQFGIGFFSVFMLGQRVR
ncbi:HD domain-containing protein, partial [Pseudomonas sp. P2758]